MEPCHLKQRFSDQYFELMGESHNAKLDNPAMSYVSISTITIVCDLSGEIDIKKLSEGFESPSFPVCKIKHTKQHNEYEISKRGKVRKSFYNQITVFYIDHSTKSIKVFSNGRLQMTGLSSIQEASKVADMMCQIIKKAPGALRSHPDHFELVSMMWYSHDSVGVVPAKNPPISNKRGEGRVNCIESHCHIRDCDILNQNHRDSIHLDRLVLDRGY